VKGEFNLITEADQFSMGAVLSQRKVPKNHPIAYGSRALNY